MPFSHLLFLCILKEVAGLFDKVTNKVSNVKKVTDERKKKINELYEPEKPLQ